MSYENAVIVVDGLAKAYQVYAKPHHRFLQSLLLGRKRFFREFWALRDVSFAIERGETIGVLGRNGSGKSTLLQLIAGTLTPTAGTVRVSGRTSAILELGAGFNPEFTGRENVALALTVAGMTENEARSRTPRIIEFADIAEFIDQPLKTYSSGMHARLAFAVAIHVSPDVLIVDEALAVGDAKFQAQCFRKFEEFKRRGITILFVTHSIDQVARHCTRAILLEQGRLVMSGEPKAVISHYLELLFGPASIRDPSPAPAAQTGTAEARSLLEHAPEGAAEFFSSRVGYNRLEHRWGDGRAKIVDFALVTAEGKRVSVLRTGDAATLYIRVLFLADIERPIFGMAIKTPDGVEIAANNSRNASAWGEFRARAGGDIVDVRFDFSCALNGGEYLVSVGVAEETDAAIVPLDRRYDSIHVAVTNSRRAFGLVDLAIAPVELDGTEFAP